jgi:hypothetical protein
MYRSWFWNSTKLIIKCSYCCIHLVLILRRKSSTSTHPWFHHFDGYEFIKLLNFWIIINKNTLLPKKSFFDLSTIVLRPIIIIKSCAQQYFLGDRNLSEIHVKESMKASKTIHLTRVLFTLGCRTCSLLLWEAVGPSKPDRYKLHTKHPIIPFRPTQQKLFVTIIYHWRWWSHILIWLVKFQHGYRLQTLGLQTCPTTKNGSTTAICQIRSPPASQNKPPDSNYK